MASTATATKHQLGYRGQARHDQPRGYAYQPVRETGAEQHDQRNHDQGVGEHVDHVQQVTAGQQRAPLRGPDLLDQENREHEPGHRGPGKLELARPDRVHRAVLVSASQPSQDRYAASPAMMMVGRHSRLPEARGLLAGLRGGRIDLGRLSNHAVVSLLLLRRNGGCQIPSYDHGRRPAVVQLPGTAGERGGAPRPPRLAWS